MANLLGYKPFYADSVVAHFSQLTKRKRRRFLDCTSELAADPFLAPDEHSTDHEGREISHISVDGFIITYWVDHAAKLVMIIESDEAD